MNLTESAALLAVIASYDRRTYNDVDVYAWQKTLHDLDAIRCKDAVVAYYARETTWLMPAHVRKLVTAAVNDQAMRAQSGAITEGASPMPADFWETVAYHREQSAPGWAKHRETWAQQPAAGAGWLDGFARKLAAEGGAA